MNNTPTVFDVGITTLTNVDALSQIAYDISDMADLIDSNDFLNAKRIYDDGENSAQYDYFGNELEQRRTLKDMSRAFYGTDGSDSAFSEDPTFLFQMLGMMNIGEDATDAIAKYATYADDFITRELNDVTSGNLAAQASVILTVQMWATHELWKGISDCFAIQNGFNPDADQTGEINPRKSFDNFVALYVGAGQTAAPDFYGDMLYANAHAAAGHFDTVDGNGEALVNKDIRQLYQSAQQVLSEDDYCKRDHSIESLWSIANRIVAKMYVPLVQMLIHEMYLESKPRVRMYAVSLIPQLSQCRPSIQRKLKTYLLDREYDPKDFTRIVSLLQQSYDCLGFSCEEVGTYNNDAVAECAGYESNHPMAGFTPKADVRTISKIDLDILAIQGLLKFPSSTNNQMAQLYYQYGRAAVIDQDQHTFDVLSLQKMAKSTYREEYSPYFQEYKDYHNGDSFYANDAIVSAFYADGMQWRNEYIVSWLQYGVVVEYLMGILGNAIWGCTRPDDTSHPTISWDSFAAAYIGSLEGTDLGGSDETIDGFLIWNTANRRSVQFDTQTEEHFAIINDEMLDLLYAGQTQIERPDCVNFEKTASRALHLMLLPLIQSTIWYAMQNEKLEFNSNDKGLVIAEILALSVLPIVKLYDETAADVIERNMLQQSVSTPVVDGAQAVANSFYQVLDEIGWGCEYLGQAENVDACKLYVPRRPSSGSMSSRWARNWRILIASIAVTSGTLLFEC
eukprot:CAMPEP_0171409026 /NCGR_PEP_ID=MMETSP0880-20121228/23308_1 /TAXON_ID=67004 /ORGANISM="Thalassiosira weissflogii, Strain CCMP1336" /LENGTH=734 /DNA_ID=CAMNT_0011925395 /DNA_START=247 /DNA_END=2448 /DNA_ORIENTATION=-